MEEHAPALTMFVVFVAFVAFVIFTSSSVIFEGDTPLSKVTKATNSGVGQLSPWTRARARSTIVWVTFAVKGGEPSGRWSAASKVAYLLEVRSSRMALPPL